jgi:SAM-dependent methyltransferase
MQTRQMRGLRALRQLASVGNGIRWRFQRKRLRGLDAVADPMIAPGVEIGRQGPIFIDKAWSPAGVTQQFIGDAGTYHKRYCERLDFVELIDRCLELAQIDRDRELRVLDIGSGSGSSVFAAARLLPRADIVASDISPQLLGMLASFVESRAELKGRITSYCFDLHRRFFRDDNFDLVLGAAILHHLLDPRAALLNVCASLKPGGKIVLVEPLEGGSLLLATMFAAVLRILADLGQDGSALARLMRALRLDIQCRLGPPVAKPWSAQLDDKWVFDEPYLVRLKEELGLSNVEVHAVQPDLTSVYEGAFLSVLADSGNQGVEIPPAVLECVREFDRGMGPELKRRLCPTGIVVFTN